MSNQQKQLEQMNGLIGVMEQFKDFLHSDPFVAEDEKSHAILNNSIKNVTEKRYVVSVIAAMKAGKSTTFNALLGRDLLPNENASCTAALTEIKHAAVASSTVQKVYRDGSILTISANGDMSLEQKFHEDVRQSRASNEVAKIDKYYLESPILALETTEYKDLVQNFILVDTPGPNEANIGDFDVTELQKIALEKLRDSDALIMLFDYQTYKSDTNATILRNIFENREDLEGDQEKIYFLINKIDSMGPKDGSVEDVIESVKRLIQMYAPVIKEPQVYAFSAKQACLSRSLLNGTLTEDARIEMKKYAPAFGKQIEIDGMVMTAVPEPEAFAERLLDQSNIRHIEKNIVDRMFSQASTKLISNSIERLEQISQNVKNSVQAQIYISNKDASELKSSVEDSKQQIDTLRTEGERLKAIPKKEIEVLKDKINEILAGLAPQAKSIIETQIRGEALEGRDQKLLMEQANVLQDNVSQSLQFMLNREVDRIQRLVAETQSTINVQLNQAFYDLSERASGIIGNKIKLQFQVFQMGDIQSQMKNDKLGEGVSDSRIEYTNGDPSEDMWTDILKGAGVGFGSGIILPGIGNIAGALVGGIVGLFKNLWSQESAKQTVYFIKLQPIRDNLKKYSDSHVTKLVQDLTRDLQVSNDKYVTFVEKQLDMFIENLKQQLDAIMKEYQKNKGNLEIHVKRMTLLRNRVTELSQTVEQIKKMD